jgi:hypothetical protein
MTSSPSTWCCECMGRLSLACFAIFMIFFLQSSCLISSGRLRTQMALSQWLFGYKRGRCISRFDWSTRDWFASLVRGHDRLVDDLDGAVGRRRREKRLFELSLPVSFQSSQERWVYLTRIEEFCWEVNENGRSKRGTTQPYLIRSLC